MCLSAFVVNFLATKTPRHNGGEGHLVYIAYFDRMFQGQDNNRYGNTPGRNYYTRKKEIRYISPAPPSSIKKASTEYTFSLLSFSVLMRHLMNTLFHS